MQTCPEGTALVLIRIHGRLWPCGARSEGEYNKPGIFRAYNFSSEAKGTSANLELRVPYLSLSLCVARSRLYKESLSLFNTTVGFQVFQPSWLGQVCGFSTSLIAHHNTITITQEETQLKPGLQQSPDQLHPQAHVLDLEKKFRGG